MRYSNILAAVAFMGSVAGTAWAAPSAEEAAQLGKTLTPLGAEKAGNTDGTIPAWTGGMCQPPAGYKPVRGEAGGAPYVDPFAAEKPLFSITAQNLDKYADKLDEGTKELFKRYPASFRMDVYPTHRTACFPDWVYQNTISRVMKPSLVGDAPGLTGAHAQVPFPIPKNGYEALWNAFLKYEPADTMFDIDTYLVDSSGGISQTALQRVANRKSYWDNTLTSVPEDKPAWALISRTIAPSSSAGSAQMRHIFLRMDQKDPMAWSYIPGQRRVRQAPEFIYDTVATTSGGVLLYDEINAFDGKMDRYDFKLLGKKELYVPYNAFLYNMAPLDDVAKPNHVDPDVLRFELHRVWVVEGTLKEGMRHVEKKKTFYIDEDSWNILAYVGIDHAGKPYHAIYHPPIQAYDKPELRITANTLYDFNRRAYLLGNRFIVPGMTGSYKVPPYSSGFFTPDSLAAGGVR